MRRITPFKSFFGLAALAIVLTSCQQAPPQGTIVTMQDQPVPIVMATKYKSSTPAPARKGPKVDPLDPCAMRLQDLITPLYFYYARYKRLPDKLAELQGVADPDMDLNFTCPVSGKPYIYNPVGLKAQDGDGLRLILYDSVPEHNGRRWGVVAGPTPNQKGEMFFQMAVVQLTEPVFKSFVPAPPWPAPTTAPDDPIETPAQPLVPAAGAGDAPAGQQ